MSVSMMGESWGTNGVKQRKQTELNKILSLYRFCETWRKFGKTNTLHRRYVINSWSLITIDKKRNCFEGTTKTYMFLPKALKAKHLYNSKAPVDALTMGIGRLVKNMLQAKQLGGLIPIYIYIYMYNLILIYFARLKILKIAKVKRERKIKGVSLRWRCFSTGLGHFNQFGFLRGTCPKLP